MSIKVKGEDLKFALSNIKKVVSGVQNIFGEVEEGLLYLSAQTEEGKARVKVPVSGSKLKSNTFGCPLVVLESAISGRKTLSISIESELIIRENEYEVRLNTIPFSKIKFVPAENAKVMQIPLDLKEAMVFALPLVALRSSITESQISNIFVRSEDNGYCFACADAHHAALIEYEKKSDDNYNFDIPVAYSSIFSSFAGNSEGSFKMKIDAANIYITSPSITVMLPLIANPNDAIKYESIKALAENTPLCTSVIEAKDISSVMGNIMSIADGSSSIMMQIGKKGFQLSCKSSLGSVTDTITHELKGKLSAMLPLEPTNFNDILGRVKNKVRISIYKNNMCSVNTKGDKHQMRFFSVGFMQ